MNFTARHKLNWWIWTEYMLHRSHPSPAPLRLSVMRTAVGALCADAHVLAASFLHEKRGLLIKTELTGRVPFRACYPFCSLKDVRGLTSDAIKRIERKASSTFSLFYVWDSCATGSCYLGK